MSVPDSKSKIWIFYDFETTGLDHQTCEVIQIGAIAVANGRRIAIFQTLVKSVDIIPTKVVEITKITNSKLENAPCLQDGWKLFWDWLFTLKPNVMIGHNSNKFDKFFLDRALLRFEHPIKECIDSYIHLDTLEIARNPLYRISSTNYKLITLVKLFNIECNEESLHGALYDSIMTFKVFKSIVDINSSILEDIWDNPSKI